MIIEWNAHMFSSDTTRYPFHPNAAYTPNASHWEADPLEAYLQRRQEENIDRAKVKGGNLKQLLWPND